MCHQNEEWCKTWGRIDFSFQNWHEEFDEFWPEPSKVSKICTLMASFWSKYIMFKLKKYRRVMFNSTENWLLLSKMTWRIWQIFVHRLENRDFVLESKTVELNWNNNSKQPDWPDTVWKLDLYFLDSRILGFWYVLESIHKLII